MPLRRFKKAKGLCVCTAFSLWPPLHLERGYLEVAPQPVAFSPP